MSFTPETTFYSSVVELIANDQGTLPATQGDLAHGALFGMIRSVDPPLADVLHNGNQAKPFTISPLYGLSPPRQGRIPVSPGQGVWLRFTLLDTRPFAAFCRYLSSDHAWSGIHLDDVSFAVDRVLTTPGSHPWAGYTTAGALRAGAAAQRQVRLLFASPMAISLGARGAAKQRMVLLPWPQYVFAALRGAWNRLTGDEIPIEFESWVADYVVVREVRHWQTSVYQLKRGVHPGGTGDVTFEALDDDPGYLSTLNLLANYAFYSGVGSKTTMGMGQAKRL